MKYIIVLPYVYKPYLDECLKTLHPSLKEHLYLIDNTERNVGIMRAHNMGVSRMQAEGADYLIIMSAAVRFGPKGGTDFIDQIEAHQDHHVIHAASLNVAGGMQANPDGGGGRNEVFGWHLTAFHRSVFEAIGRWDENFSPYGFDDLDLSIRIRKHFATTCRWDTFPCDVHDTTMSHSINLAGVKSPSEPKIEYFRKKWGRAHGDWMVEPWAHPFNDPGKPLSWWPTEGDPLANKEAWEFLHGQGI